MNTSGIAIFLRGGFQEVAEVVVHQHVSTQYYSVCEVTFKHVQFGVTQSKQHIHSLVGERQEILDSLGELHLRL